MKDKNYENESKELKNGKARKSNFFYTRSIIKTYFFLSIKSMKATTIKRKKLRF